MRPDSRLRALSSLVLLSAPLWFPSGAIRGQAGHPASTEPVQSGPSGDRLQRLYQRAIAAIQQDRLPEARADLESLLKANPKSPGLHDFLGYGMLRQSEYDPAISEFKKALQIKPDFQQARIHLAEALQVRGELPEAIEEFQRASELGPLDASARIAYGRALSGTGSNEKAEDQLKSAI